MSFVQNRGGFLAHFKCLFVFFEILACCCLPVFPLWRKKKRLTGLCMEYGPRRAPDSSILCWSWHSQHDLSLCELGIASVS